MTGYRVTMTTERGKRIATSLDFNTKAAAEVYADLTNKYHHKSNARVVKDSERVRRMIP